jgi:hypothetical protein
MVQSSSPPTSSPNPPARSLVAAVAPVVVAPVAVVLILIAFAWPAARLAPRDLPVGVAGPAADAVAARLSDPAGPAGSADAVDVRRYPDEAAARAAVQAREVYGVVVAGPGGVTVLTSSAASPVVANLLARAAGAAGEPAPTAAKPSIEAAARSSAPRVVDVVPTPAGDPRGVALASSLLPLVLTGMFVAGMTTSTTRPGFRQIGVLVAASAAVGLAATGVVQGWLGILGGSWWADAGVIAFLVLAVAAAAAGLRALLGVGGFVLGAALFVVVGNSWSGFTSAPEMLPRAVGAIGGLLPPGAGGSLLRSVAFFDGNGAGGHVGALAGWTLAGMIAVVARAILAAGRAAPSQADASDPPGTFDPLGTLEPLETLQPFETLEPYGTLNPDDAPTVETALLATPAGVYRAASRGSGPS